MEMEAPVASQDDNGNGDILAVNDDNAVGNGPTTPVASRALIQEGATGSTTPEASASILSPISSSPNNSNTMLREWSDTPNMTQVQAISNISSPIPPVAPAVLLIQREGSSNSNASATVDAIRARSSNSYQYPVATFVRNVARSVREEIRDHMAQCSVHRSQNLEALLSSRVSLEVPVTVTATNCITNNNSNNDIRIDNDAMPTIPIAQSQTGLSNTNASAHVADLEDDDQEWTMINGELVRIYPQEVLETNESDSGSIGNISRDDIDFMQKYDRHSNKSSRMQRGVRKLKKIRKIFSGGNNMADGQKKKGDRKKLARGESKRRNQREYEEQNRRQRDNPNYTNSDESRNQDSGEYSISHGGAQLSTNESSNTRLYRGTASVDGNETDDGGSLIVAPTAISNNNSHDGDNSTISTNIIVSEEFSLQAGSHRSTLSGPVNSSSPSSSIRNQSQKKRMNRLPRWLRGTGTDSSSSNRTKLPSDSPGPGSLLSRKKKHKQPPSSGASSPPRRSSHSKPTMNSSQSHQRDLLREVPHSPVGREIQPILQESDCKPAALGPQRDGRGIMPPLREASQEFASASRLSPPLMSESPLHASASITSQSELHRFPSVPSGQEEFQRSSSIAAQASFVGHTDTISTEAEAGIEYIIEDLYEYDKYDEKNLKGLKEYGKMDKQEGACIDTMLERAEEIAKDLTQDDDAQLKLPPPNQNPLKKGKSGGESVPLSTADSGDEIIHNDILKLVLVGDNTVDKSGLGRSLRKSTKKHRQRTRLTVDVHTWIPSNADVRLTMWEVLSSKSVDPYLPNFGARPGTQSLFFSDQSLYLLVYDLGVNNPETLRHFNKTSELDSDDECSDDEWDEHHNAFLREEANRKADRALHADIKERVLSWVNCIAQRVAHSAILPIALVPPNMSPEEVRRRCNVMQTLISNHVEKLPSNFVRPKILCGPETVHCVSLHNNMGLDDLERMILEIADASNNVFHHVGKSVSPRTFEIMKVCRDLKKTSKMISVNHLIAKLPQRPEYTEAAVKKDLYFLATIGEVLYFGGSDPVLEDYVILCRKWLVGALSCILRNDLQRELAETRQFFQYQTFYSDQQFHESHVTQTFLGGSNSSCPILSCQDTQMLWQSANFMMEAVDQSSQRSDNSTTTQKVFDFLLHLLEKTDVFLPLDIDRFSSTDKIYFVPSLLSQASSRDVWTYKSSESWMVTLCHTWLFRDGAPAGLMEQVTTALLRDLYESSHANAETPERHGTQSRSHRQLQRSQTFPFGQSSMTNYLDSRDGEPIGQIKIHQINCWKNSLLLKLGRVFPKDNELKESIIEIFVAVTDQVSPHSVASDTMRSNMQRLVVSGKGEVGLHGQKLWKGGYNVVLDSIKASVPNLTNVERQVVCPECLAHRPACSANTWSWDSVVAASDHTVRCMMGHRADRNLICGTAPASFKYDDGGKIGNTDKKAIKEILPSVVIVGLWDNETKTILNVGSGFIANKKLGLIVTASHILFNMEKGPGFGIPYRGLKNASAIIGIIPTGGKSDTTAVFRYFAEIVAYDIHNMDACVLKIKSRLEKDVNNYSLVGEQPKKVLENIQEEALSSLKLTSRYEIEQAVRIIGFNQGGEGRLEKGKHVNRISDFALGYICKQFKISDDESTSSDDSSSSEEGVLVPREEIVVMVNTIQGHSGGPCVNDDGKVVGILSRSDPADRQRCYLVPSSEIKTLITEAKKRVVGY